MSNEVQDAPTAARLQAAVTSVNYLLGRCHIEHTITSLNQCNPSMFVVLFERLCAGFQLSNIDRQPKQTLEQKLSNTSEVIRQLEQMVGQNLSHIDANGVVRGDPFHLCFLIEIFKEIVQVQLQEAGNRAVVLSQLPLMSAPPAPTGSVGRSSFARPYAVRPEREESDVYPADIARLHVGLHNEYLMGFSSDPNETLQAVPQWCDDFIRLYNLKDRLAEGVNVLSLPSMSVDSDEQSPSSSVPSGLSAGMPVPAAANVAPLGYRLGVIPALASHYHQSNNCGHVGAVPGVSRSAALSQPLEEEIGRIGGPGGLSHSRSTSQDLHQDLDRARAVLQGEFQGILAMLGINQAPSDANGNGTGATPPGAALEVNPNDLSAVSMEYILRTLSNVAGSSAAAAAPAATSSSSNTTTDVFDLSKPLPAFSTPVDAVEDPLTELEYSRIPPSEGLSGGGGVGGSSVVFLPGQNQQPQPQPHRPSTRAHKSRGTAGAPLSASQQRQRQLQLLQRVYALVAAQHLQQQAPVETPAASEPDPLPTGATSSPTVVFANQDADSHTNPAPAAPAAAESPQQPSSQQRPSRAAGQPSPTVATDATQSAQPARRGNNTNTGVSPQTSLDALIALKDSHVERLVRSDLQHLRSGEPPQVPSVTARIAQLQQMLDDSLRATALGEPLDAAVLPAQQVDPERLVQLLSKGKIDWDQALATQHHPLPSSRIFHPSTCPTATLPCVSSSFSSPSAPSQSSSYAPHVQQQAPPNPPPFAVSSRICSSMQYGQAVTSSRTKRVHSAPRVCKMVAEERQKTQSTVMNMVSSQEVALRKICASKLSDHRKRLVEEKAMLKASQQAADDAMATMLAAMEHHFTDQLNLVVEETKRLRSARKTIAHNQKRAVESLTRELKQDRGKQLQRHLDTLRHDQAVKYQRHSELMMKRLALIET